jgi:gliding motility-associated-like protein
VNKKDYPVITTNAPESICEGDNLTVTASGASTYTWQDGSSNETYTEENMVNSKTFYVIGTENGCETKEQFTVSILPKPYVWITGDRDICVGQNINLSASGAKSYKWNNGATGSTLSETTTTAQKSYYSVTGTDEHKCHFTTEPFEVIVHALPTINITGDDSICNGSVAHLTANGASEYVWSTGERDANVYPVITKDQNFTVTGTDAYGCVNTKTHTIRNLDYPELVYNAPKQVCAGDSINIAIQGADRYTWKGKTYEGSTFTLKDKPMNLTTYNVVGNHSGCESSISFQVDVIQLPNIWISGPSSVCLNSAIQLTASGAMNYEWSTGSKASIITDRPTETKTYTVTGKDINGCKNTQSYTVHIDSLPSFKIQGPTYACQGDAVNLSIEDGDAVRYTWSNGAISDAITPIINNATSFTVEAISAKGCVTTKIHNIKCYPYPILTYTGPSEVCAGDLAKFNVVGAATYKWSHDNENTTGTMTDNPTNNKTYIVEGTANHCSTKLSIPISVLPKPNVTFQGVTNICEGHKLDLTAYGASSYKWSTGNNTDHLEVYPKANSKFTLTGTDLNGCQTTINVPVTINPSPNFEILGEDSVCRGFYVQLTAKGDGENYYWGFGTNTMDDAISRDGEAIATEVNTSTYIFTKAIDKNGCESTKYKLLTLKESPSINYTGVDVVCVGNPAKLYAHGAEHYTWNFNNKNVTGDSLIFMPEGNTRITLSGTKGACTTEMEIHVTAHVTPNIRVTGDSIVCQGDAAVLLAEGAATYKWSNGKEGRILIQNIEEDNVFTVIGTSESGCESKKDVKVRVNKRPHVWMKQNAIEGCPGTDTRVDISAHGDAISYEWSSIPKNGEISGNMSDHIYAVIDQETAVTLVGTDANGCTSSDTMTVDTLTFLPIEFSVSPSIILEENPVITMKGIYPRHAKWYWNTGDDYNTEVQGVEATYRYPNPSVRDSFVVTALAIDEKGCEYVGDSTIWVWKNFWAPNAFSPNDDGLNDVFRFLGTEFMTSFHFIIYNREGTIMFEGFTKEDEWDGTYNGEPAPFGVYGYVVTWESDFKDVHKDGERKGSVTLIR